MGWTLNCNKSWHIPRPDVELVEGQPAIYACFAPDYYYTADQECIISIVQDVNFNAEETWDESCYAAYNCCIDRGCLSETACNYDAGACSSDPSSCQECTSLPDEGANCFRIDMTSTSQTGWEIQDFGFVNSPLPPTGEIGAFWTLTKIGPSLGFSISGTLSRPDGALLWNEPTAFSGSDGHCLPDGCYEFNVVCPGGPNSTFNCNSAGWTISGMNEFNGSLGGAGSTSLLLTFGNATLDEDNESLIEGCTDPEACNYNPDACIDDGSCDLTEGCTNVFACNFEPAACVDDGSCEFCYFSNCVTVSTNIIGFGSGNWSIVDESGTFPIGINGSSFTGSPAETTFCIDDGCYTFELNSSGGLFPNPLATWTIEGADGGTISGSGNASFQISFGGSGGCTDPVACNYNASACLDLDNCQYPGCNDPGACNYNPDAGDCGFVECEYSEVYVSITDNGSTGVVVYPEELGGCTNELAPNYDAGALFDDGSCILSYLCGPGTYYDMDLATCLPNSCLGDFDGSGDVATNDLLTFLGVYGQSCD